MNLSGKLYARLLGGAAILALTAVAAHAEARTFNIKAQPLSTALPEFGVQSGAAVLATHNVTGEKMSRDVSDVSDPDTALKRMLEGTGLTYTRKDGAYLIVKVDAAVATTRAAARLSTIAAAETVSGSAIEGLVVTAQKRREKIQDVPIAISAFSAEALQAQKIEGGFDLLKAIPNVTFSKNNFTSYNFSIRGIGTKAISATTDPGVAVAFNSTGLIQNRLFEQEYFDIERVEVLRGPQGTLYGRNATSGVINVISAKPDLGEFDGSLKGEVGNYHTKRLSGFVNVPLIEDVLAVRFAGALTSREGYDYNSVTDHAVNGRDLWSGRLTIGFEPTESIRADFIWERFNEDDDRSRTGKQLCHRDDGPQMIGSTPVSGVHPEDVDNPYSDQLRPALFSQGCKPGSLYDDAAFGTPNGLALPFVFAMLALGGDCGSCSQFYPLGYDANGHPQTLVAVKDPYAGMMQSRDLRTIASFKDPRYQAHADVLELNIDFDITDHLTFTSQTGYTDDTVYSFQDFNRFNTVPVFTDTTQLFEIDNFGNPIAPSAWTNLAPGGVFCDPQLGCSNTLAGFDISRANAEQFSQEFRLQSSFDGPLNFSVGANYTTFDTLVDYYVFYNLITAYALMLPFNAPQNGEIDLAQCVGSGYFGGGPPVSSDDPTSICPYIDPNPIENINGEGHNYFRSKNPYKLKSSAAFGELYWQFSDAVKITAGLRYTDDQKTFIPVPSQILLANSVVAGGTVGKGYPSKPPIEQEWGEWTGRLGVDWKPDLSFTDETMLYAFYSRGYKGGGANPPSPGFASLEEVTQQMLAAGFSQDIIDIYIERDLLPILQLTAVEYGPTFEPEFVNAFEVGAKNTLLGGGLTVNVNAFYYDYKDYQVSQIRDRTAVNENFDAKIWGSEFESVFAPSENLQIIFNVGYLDTEIADGEASIDIMNRTQGDPNYTVTKPWAQLPSNCVVPTGVAESWLQEHYFIQLFWPMCGGVGGVIGFFSTTPPIDPNPAFGGGLEPYDYRNYPELNGGAGIKAQLGGNELPNAPHVTANIGAQYGWDLFGGEWRATVRGDAYWQSQSWARVYNLDQYDKLHGWYNANLSFWIEKPEEDLRFEFYVKNVLDDTPITDAFLNSDDTALTTNVFTLDPRLIGLQITKGF